MAEQAPVKATGFMQKKVAGVPMPLAVLGAAVVVWFLYKRLKTASAPAATAPAQTTPTPDQTGAIAAPPSTNGTGGGGIGDQMSSQLLQALLAQEQLYSLGTTGSYNTTSTYYGGQGNTNYYGNQGGTNPAGAPGADTTSPAPVTYMPPVLTPAANARAVANASLWAGFKQAGG